jgi:hypothetical protein
MPQRRILPPAGDGSKLTEMIGAVIYVRVSAKEQTENLSLPTQLRACEEYCRRQGYDVLERFHEEGESAKTTDRSQLQALLQYCRTHRGQVHFVVVYNLTRFAREKYDHFALRAHLQSLGISLRSATEPIDDTFVDELALLQPTPGYMRVVKDRGLYVWEEECSAARARTVEQERRLKAVRLKLDRLDEAFLYSESIDLDTYSRQRDKLREELTLSKIDYHTDAVEELDVEGILAFSERILPRAADLWVQASLDYRQRLQELFFPEGIAYDGNRFNRTAVTAPLFRYLEPDERTESSLASLMPASWNQITLWLWQVDELRRVA